MEPYEHARGCGHLLAVLVGATACASVPRLVEDGAYDPAYLEEVAARTARERRLAASPESYPPATEVVDRDQLRLMQRTRMEMVGAMEDTYPDDFCRSFGLASETRFADAALAHESSTLSAYYDFQAKRLTLVEREPDAGLGELSALVGRDLEGEFVVSHELVHALQDERWDLLARSRSLGERRDSEASLAFEALVEGDAMLGGLRAVFGTLVPEAELCELVRSCMLAHGEQSEDARGLALWMSALSSFPYSEGGLFVKALHERGGWSAVDAAFERPPETTEQILHPEKYHAGEGSIPVDMPELAAADDAWHPADVMGEFATRAMLRALGLEAATAERAAAGWGGDVLRVGRSDGGAAPAALLWETAWDSALDADEFEAAFAGLPAFRVTRVAADRVRVERADGARVALR
jgi:hypothetical protein